MPKNRLKCKPVKDGDVYKCERCGKVRHPKAIMACFIDEAERQEYLNKYGVKMGSPVHRSNKPVNTRPGKFSLVDPTGVGTIYKKELESWGAEGCSSCATAAHEMNSLGPDGVEAKIEDFVERSYRFSQKNHSLLGVFAKVAPGVAVKAAIRMKIREAIAKSRELKQAEFEAKAVRSITPGVESVETPSQTSSEEIE